MLWVQEGEQLLRASHELVPPVLRDDEIGDRGIGGFVFSAGSLTFGGNTPPVGVTCRRFRRLSDRDRRFVWIQRGMTPRQKQAVFELGLEGLRFEEESRRMYPHGKLAGHFLGFTNVDGKGVEGAEAAFDANARITRTNKWRTRITSSLHRS